MSSQPLHLLTIKVQISSDNKLGHKVSVNQSNKSECFCLLNESS